MDAAAIGVLLLLCAYILHKVRNMHLLVHAMKDEAQRGHATFFRQLEALQGLYVSLGLQRALPLTRGWAASPDFLQELAAHALDERPRCVVECSSGTSTLVLARCMQINGAGKVYSLEHDPVYARRTRRQLELHGLAEWATIIDAPLLTQAFGSREQPWYDRSALAAISSIDMVVIDGPPQATSDAARYPAGPVLFPKLASGAAVFLDDSMRPGERTSLQRWAEEFPDMEILSLPCEKGAAVLRYRPVAAMRCATPAS
ncbi:class I SAM-dependent methyltransferase [Pseudoduganella eburnea]|uniref:Class I SAM-dependent methyltransferase n=1 Tax=Massilia eburnea TaxID=1776165 RepID=A0A6L6QNH6_9BURK|nr:class I SAM-dependent methyltransferase [Massilia eburnea]MTW13942.1 class I SAM-dependent methyltransferase [Massilia eburnea]